MSILEFVSYYSVILSLNHVLVRSQSTVLHKLGIKSKSVDSGGRAIWDNAIKRP